VPEEVLGHQQFSGEVVGLDSSSLAVLLVASRKLSLTRRSRIRSWPWCRVR